MELLPKSIIFHPKRTVYFNATLMLLSFTVMLQICLLMESYKKINKPPKKNKEVIWCVWPDHEFLYEKPLIKLNYLKSQLLCCLYSRFVHKQSALSLFPGGVHDRTHLIFVMQW
jgi:hypothetical protein